MKIDAFKSWFKRHEKTIALSFAAVFLIIGLYFERDNIKQLNIPLSLNDAVQALGQFATVGAFWIGFKQLQKSRADAKEAEAKERRNSIATAASLQVSKMTQEVRALDRFSPTPEDACEFINKMNSFAGNFAKFFWQMEKGDQRDYVILEWQDMFFNDLLPKLYSMNIMSLVSTSVGQTQRAIAAQYAFQMQQTHAYLEPYERYYEAYNILDNLLPHMPTDLKRQYEEESSSFFLFKEHFFSPAYVDQLLEGTMNIVDFQIQAPALAAIFEKFGRLYHGLDG